MYSNKKNTMAKAIFIDNDVNETVIEVPKHLVIINELTEVMAENGLMGDDDEEEFGTSSFDRGYQFLEEELTEIFCKEKNVDSKNYYAEMLILSDDDIENEVELKVNILYLV